MASFKANFAHDVLFKELFAAFLCFFKIVSEDIVLHPTCFIIILFRIGFLIQYFHRAVFECERLAVGGHDRVLARLHKKLFKVVL